LLVRAGELGINSLIEAFSGSLRREVCRRHSFASIAEARQILARWPTSRGGSYTPDANVAFVTKPWTVSDMLAQVRALLDRTADEAR
jgi:hypothetical protein